MADTNITATVLRRKLRDALKSVEAGNGRVVITRHNKVVAALVSAEDLARLQALPAAVVNVSKGVVATVGTTGIVGVGGGPASMEGKIIGV